MSYSIVEMPPLLCQILGGEEGTWKTYPTSIQQNGALTALIARGPVGPCLLLIAEVDFSGADAFEGDLLYSDECYRIKKAPLDHYTAMTLREFFPWTAPAPVPPEKCSFGCGDRTGSAARGLAETFRKYNVFPVFAQQTPLELESTNRTWDNMVDEATFQVFEAGYTDGFGADADHVKTMVEIDGALNAGVTMVTLDVSDHLNPEYCQMPAADIKSIYLKSIPQGTRTMLESAYLSQPAVLKHSTLDFSIGELMRCSMIYLDALDWIEETSRKLELWGGLRPSLEISLDEMPVETTPSQHYFFASELIRRGVEFQSIALKYPGNFAIAMDYYDVKDEFEKSFRLHEEIAETFESYKLGLHHIGDKYALLPMIGKITKCHCHFKTSGTGWMDAMRTLSLREPELFRQIYETAVDFLQDGQKKYPTVADFSTLPKLDHYQDAELPTVLESNAARQMLHITYGSILGTDPDLGEMIRMALYTGSEFYAKLLDQHYDRHLNLLNVPKKLVFPNTQIEKRMAHLREIFTPAEQ